jgi:hypothetical protein
MSQAAEILKAIRDYEPPRELQPISKLALRLYLENDRKLEKPQLDQLRAELDAIEDLVAFTDALCGLLVFSNYASGPKLNDPATSELVLQIVREKSSRYDEIFAMAATSTTDEAQRATETLGRFLGDEEEELQRRAPQYGGAVPDGAVSVASLNPAPLRPLHIKPKAKPPVAMKR